MISHFDWYLSGWQKDVFSSFSFPDMNKWCLQSSQDITILLKTGRSEFFSLLFQKMLLRKAVSALEKCEKLYRKWIFLMLIVLTNKFSFFVYNKDFQALQENLLYKHKTPSCFVCIFHVCPARPYHYNFSFNTGESLDPVIRKKTWKDTFSFFFLFSG